MTDEPDMSLAQAKQLLDIQKRQIEQARATFFNLASIRGAELVIHQGKTLEQAIEYRNAEIQALDAQLTQHVPPELMEIKLEEPRTPGELEDCA
jgi:hypothetical protein